MVKRKIKAVKVMRPTMVGGNRIEPGIYYVGRDFAEVDAVQLIIAGKAEEHIIPKPEPKPEPKKEVEPVQAVAVPPVNREDNSSNARKVNTRKSKRRPKKVKLSDLRKASKGE